MTKHSIAYTHTHTVSFMVTTHKKYVQNTHEIRRERNQNISLQKKISEIQRKIKVRKKDQKDYNRQKTFNKWQ